MPAPPLQQPPRLPTMDDDSPLRRIRFRLWQIGLSAITVGVTAWCYTLSPIVGIAATFLAKHILVAILAAGLEFPEEQRPPLAG